MLLASECVILTAQDVEKLLDILSLKDKVLEGREWQRAKDQGAMDLIAELRKFARERP